MLVSIEVGLLSNTSYRPILQAGKPKPSRLPRRIVPILKTKQKAITTIKGPQFTFSSAGLKKPSKRQLKIPQKGPQKGLQRGLQRGLEKSTK